MRRRTPPKSTIKKKLRNLRERASAADYRPEIISLRGVPATPVGDDEENEDGPVENGPVEDDEDDEDAAETETSSSDPPRIETDLHSGERTLYIDGEEVDAYADDLPECSSEECPNPVCPPLETCEKCAGMPERDWRPTVG